MTACLIRRLVAGRSVGVRVELPFEQEVNPFVAIPQCIGSVEETVAILRASREEWLRQQAMRAAAPDR
jgi:hypothetical protein